MKTEKEFAKELAEAAKTVEITDGGTMTIEKNTYGKYNLDVLNEEINKLGYKIIPVEQSVLGLFQVKDKMAIIKK